MSTLTSSSFPLPSDDSDRPPLPSVPPPDSDAHAVQKYLTTYWRWCGYGYDESVYLARKLQGVDAEMLYRFEEKLEEVYGCMGRCLWDRIQRERWGVVSFCVSFFSVSLSFCFLFLGRDGALGRRGVKVGRRIENGWLMMWVVW